MVLLPVFVVAGERFVFAVVLLAVFGVGVILLFLGLGVAVVLLPVFGVAGEALSLPVVLLPVFGAFGEVTKFDGEYFRFKLFKVFGVLLLLEDI